MSRSCRRQWQGAVIPYDTPAGMIFLFPQSLFLGSDGVACNGSKSICGALQDKVSGDSSFSESCKLAALQHFGDAMAVRKFEKKAVKKTRIGTDLDYICNLRLDSSLVDDLKKYASTNGLPVSLTIRMILKKFFEFKK